MSFKRLQRALFRTMAAVVALAILFCIGLYGYRTMFGYTYDSSLSDEDLAASVTADENITNIALFGLDTREGDKQSHSDCMMIVTVGQHARQDQAHQPDARFSGRYRRLR